MPSLKLTTRCQSLTIANHVAVILLFWAYCSIAPIVPSPYAIIRDELQNDVVRGNYWG